MNKARARIIAVAATGLAVGALAYVIHLRGAERSSKLHAEPAALEAARSAQMDRARKAVEVASQHIDEATRAAPEPEHGEAFLSAHAVALLRTTAHEMSAIGPDPLRENIRAGIVQKFLENGGLAVSKSVLQRPQETLSTFGEDQAHVRTLALAALDASAKEHMGDVVETTQKLASHLSATGDRNKGVQYDYRDLLYTYFKAKGFDAIESNPDQFLKDIGSDERVQGLARKFTLQYFDSNVSEDRLYPLLRKIGSAS